MCSESGSWFDFGRLDGLKGTGGLLVSRGPRGTTRAARDALGIHFFLGGCFCLGVFSGLFLGDWLVIGLSGCFRSLWISLGISVGNQVLEIVGLDSRLGLRMGDFLAWCMN